jgi:hypothetical protein
VCEQTGRDCTGHAAADDYNIRFGGELQ